MSLKVRTPIGRRGEAEAANFLLAKGYRIVELNFRKNYTEIDLIAENGETTVFVEVTVRTNDKFGTPFEAITKQKIENIVRTARTYMKMHRHLPKTIRVDAIGVVFNPFGEVEEIEHVENISGF